MFRRLVPVVVVTLVLAACGSAGEVTGTTAVETGSGSVTTSTAPGTTSTSPSSTTTDNAPSTTTSVTIETTTSSGAPGAGGSGDLPATFVAITTDYEAVAVDSASGEIVHIYGQTGTAEDVAAAEEMLPNVLVGIWRVRDGSMVGISDCCEPAAGNIFYVPSDGELGDRLNAEWNTGWTLSPSPAADVFASLGYTMIVEDPSSTDDTDNGLTIDEPQLGFPGGTAAWARDGSQLFWVTTRDGTTGLATLDLADGAPAYVSDLTWIGDGQWMDGIGSQVSDNLVGFVHSYDNAQYVVATEGVVFTTTGQLVATFPVETGAVWGGYDPAGIHLIYVDGETVRWQGGGDSGVLADGFLFASW